MINVTVALWTIKVIAKIVERQYQKVMKNVITVSLNTNVTYAMRRCFQTNIKPAISAI